MQKLYLTYNRIHKTAQRLAREVQASEFEPDVMVAIGTGGFIPARILKTFLKMPIFTVGITYYDEQNRPQERPKSIE